MAPTARCTTTTSHTRSASRRCSSISSTFPTAASRCWVSRGTAVRKGGRAAMVSSLPWGGFRDDLAKRGVRFDADLLLTPQGVASGGHDTGARFWGNTEYTLDVDTGKGGLWPGGFLGRRGVEPRLRTLRRGVSGGRRRCEVGVGRESGLDGGRRADVESGVATG